VLIGAEEMLLDKCLKVHLLREKGQGAGVDYQLVTQYMRK